MLSVPAVRESNDWDLSSIGLKLSNPDLPIEAYTELCWMLGKMHEAVRFAIGDAIMLGEKLYGEESFQAMESLNLSEEARRQYLRVSERVPRSIRRKDLSWSHHRAVASLSIVGDDGTARSDHKAQKEWLKAASDQGLSHHALRDALRDGSEPLAATTCRCCHRPL